MRKTRRRSRTRSRRRQRGGKRIGNGVFSPPLRCAGETPYTSEEYVSKFFTEKDHADTEYENGMILQAIDPEQTMFVTPLHRCDANAEQTNANTPDEPGYLLVYKHAGSTIVDLPEEQKVRCIKATLPLLSILHQNSLAHLDIHPQNIVYDGTRTRLIDFHTLTSLKGIDPLKQEELKFTDIDAMFGLILEGFSFLYALPRSKVISTRGEIFADWMRDAVALHKKIGKSWGKWKVKDIQVLSMECKLTILGCPVGEAEAKAEAEGEPT